jgi:hypothetical protein
MGYVVKCVKANDYGRCPGGYSFEKGCYRDMSEYRIMHKDTGEIFEPVYLSYWEAKKALKEDFGYTLRDCDIIAFQPFEPKDYRYVICD